MLQKRVLSILGSALVVVGIILAVNGGLKSLRGSMYDIGNLISSGVFIIIGGPLILGTILIILSLQIEKKRKIILLAESVILFIYAINIFLFVFGRSCIYGINQGLLHYIKYDCQWIPFKTIGFYISHLLSGQIERGQFIEELVGDFMMFMPLGFLFPAIFKNQKKWLYFLITLVSIFIIIKLLQYEFMIAFFDIDEFMLNMAGACLIYAVIRIGIIKRFLNKTRLI